MAKEKPQKSKQKQIEMYKPHFIKWGEILEVTFNFEYQFDSKRKWAVDAAIICCNIAIEIEGGATAGKGHRGIGNFLKDMEKYNALTIQGWHLLRFTPTQIKNEMYIDRLTDYLHNYPCSHQALNQSIKEFQANLYEE